MRNEASGRKVSIRLGVTFVVTILFLISVAATYETYGRGEYLRERLQAAVEAGKITQEQADDKLELMSNRKTNGWKHRNRIHDHKHLP